MSFKALLVQQIRSELNRHARGVKHVFISNKDTRTALTQFAYGIMAPGDQSGVHFHETMDEYFYFIKGNGVYEIGDQSVEIIPETFVSITSGTSHNLINTGDSTLEFVYFGIAIE